MEVSRTLPGCGLSLEELERLPGLHSEDSPDTWLQQTGPLAPSEDEDDVEECKARDLFVAAVQGASDTLSSYIMRKEICEEKSLDKMVEFIETFLEQADTTGHVAVAVNLLRQLADIDQAMFTSSLLEAVKTFLNQSYVSRDNVGQVMSQVLQELQEVRAAVSQVLVDVLTEWVVSPADSPLSLRSCRGRTALGLLQRPDICRHLQDSAAQRLGTLCQELKNILIHHDVSQCSESRTLVLEMLLLINRNSAHLELQEERRNLVNKVAPLQQEDPAGKVLPRLVTSSMAHSFEAEDSEEEVEEIALEESFGIMTTDFRGNLLEVYDEEDTDAEVQHEGEESDISVVVEYEVEENSDAMENEEEVEEEETDDSDASVVVEYERILKKDGE